MYIDSTCHDIVPAMAYKNDDDIQFVVIDKV
jgi:hypothetical protein